MRKRKWRSVRSPTTKHFSSSTVVFRVREICP